MDLLPYFIVEEILLYLDREDLVEVCRASRSLYTAALPLLFRVVTLPEDIHADHAKLIVRMGKYVKGLIVNDTNPVDDIIRSGGSLCSTFPCLRAIAINEVEVECFVEDNWFLQAKDMKELKFFGATEELTPTALLKVNQIECIFSGDVPEGLEHAPAHLKRVVVPYEIEYILDPSRIAFPFELVFVDGGFGEIPIHAVDELRVIRSFDMDEHYTLFLPAHPENLTRFQEAQDRRRLRPIGDGIHFETFQCDGITSVMDLPLDVVHCLITHDDGKYLPYFSPFARTSSLAIRLSRHDKNMDFEILPFQTTRLSLAVDTDEFDEFLDWSTACFQQLEHLDLHNVVSMDLIPKFVFPNLKAFHCAILQPEAFWFQLVRTSPQLETIYASKMSRRLKPDGVLKPGLAIKPYQKLHKETSDFLIEEFYKYV